MPRGVFINDSSDHQSTKPKGGKSGRFSGDHLVQCFESEYEDLLKTKLEQFHGLMAFTGFNRDDVEVFESPRSHFRMRANFSIWRDNRYSNNAEGMYYVMFDMSNTDPETERVLKKPCEIKNFPRGSVLINKLMVKLMDLCHDEGDEYSEVSKVLRDDLFEVRFVTTQANEAIVILIYRKPLNDVWTTAAKKALGIFQEHVGGDTVVKILGRSKKVKKVIPEVDGVSEIEKEMIVERYQVKGKEYLNYQIEGAFSQPNAKVCEKMLTWSSDVTEGSHDKDLLELYCGGGTFTSVLAGNFKRVVATEVSKPSVKLANKAFAANNIENIKIGALSSEDFTAAFKEKRNLRVLADAGIRITEYDIDTVLVDPPRAGLDCNTCQLLCQFRAIVYISCNPETLARDIKIMNDTHEVKRMAAFDQFPYTPHLEGGVYLVKRPGLSPDESNKKQKLTPGTLAMARDTMDTRDTLDTRDTMGHSWTPLFGVRRGGSCLSSGYDCTGREARGTCDEVMIVSADQGALYASAPETFKLREYKAMVIDEETYEDKEVTVNEAVNLVKMIEKASGKGGPGVSSQGLRLNSGKKQMLIREFQDDTSKQGVVYAKIPKGGCCVAGAGKVILIGTFNETKGQTASECNDTIELYARYLATSTWPDGSEGTAQSTAEQAKRTWQPFADILLIGKGDVNECLICRKRDAMVYASAAADKDKPCDFDLKQYEAEVPQEDGTDKLMPIDEVGALLRLMNSPIGTRPTGGIRVNKVKYQFLRGAEDLESKCNTIFGKKSKGGVIICATNSLIVVATYDELKGHSATSCGTIVSDMCGNLNRAGY